MTLHLQDDSHVQFISSLKQQLQIFKNREQFQVKEGQLREMGASLLADINDRFSLQNQLIKNIAAKWDSFLDSFTQMKDDYEQQISQLHEELQYKTATIDNNHEVITHLENKIKMYEEEYDKLKLELGAASQKIDKQDRQYALERKEIVKALDLAEEQTELDKATISKIINQKQLLFDQIKDQRRLSQQLKEQIQTLKHHLSEQVQLIKDFESLLQQLRIKNNHLEDILQQKQISIEALQNQLSHYQQISEEQKLMPNFNELPSQNEVEDDSPITTQNLMKRSIRLNDDIPFNEPFGSLEFSRKLSQINFHDLQTHKQNIYRHNQEETMSHTFKMSLDPYFAHFILTSQSVKIKQDCQQLLNIDIKPYYKQIVEKRIPMHLWDQWIRNRLNELMRKMKAMEDDEDEDLE